MRLMRPGGGRKVADAQVRKGAVLGKSPEGTLFSATVNVKSSKNPARMKSRHLTLKRFIEIDAERPSVYNPVAQVKQVNALMRINNQNKLGLRLPATARLLRKEGSPDAVVVTRKEVLQLPSYFWIKNTTRQKEWAPFSKEAKIKMNQFYKDALRQQRIADEHGYFIDDICFKPVAGANGQVEAHVLSLGGVYNLEELASKDTKKYNAVQKHVGHERERIWELPL